MNTAAVILSVVALALVGLAAALALAWRRAAAQRDDWASRARDADAARALAEQRLTDLEQNETRLREMIDSLAAKALHANSEEFLKLARTVFEREQKEAAGALEQRKQAVESLVKPLQESLKRTGETLRTLEEERVKEYGALRQFTQNVSQTTEALRAETGRLVQALRKPQVRGRYGEIQLERVVELAGMRPYCDFATQVSATGDEGARLRPDVVVRLPNDRAVVIDAKTNLDAYLDALDAPDPDAAEAHLARYARHVLEQARALAKKDYAAAVGSAPEFVVMFIPGDQFIDAALQREPTLLDLAA
ncbi:MAG: DNA recombination protein RmuC, partial [Planctomycetota bacterium]